MTSSVPASEVGSDWRELAQESGEADIFDLLYYDITGKRPPWPSGWEMAVEIAEAVKLQGTARQKFRDLPEHQQFWVIMTVVTNDVRFDFRNRSELQKFQDFAWPELERLFGRELSRVDILRMARCFKDGFSLERVRLIVH